MMRFFVRNLFAKLFLLGLLAVPLVLYGLNEFKQLAEAGIEDKKEPPSAPNNETELKQAQEESGKVAAMPSDLRKELIFPGGRPTNDAAEPYGNLSKAVRNRAGILGAHRQFLLQLNAQNLKDLQSKPDPLYAANLGKDLVPRYTKVLDDKRDQLIAQTHIKELQKQLEKFDAKSLSTLAKEINDLIDEYSKRWKETTEVTALRRQLKEAQLTVASDAADAECMKSEAAWKRLLQLPSAEAIKALQAQIDDQLKRLRSLRDDAKSQNDEMRTNAFSKHLLIWSSRRDFLPDAATLLESFSNALAEARVEDFLSSCKKLVSDHPSIDEAKNLVRGIAEDFCTRYLVKPPKEPLKYDDVVNVRSIDGKTVQGFPRKQVKVYFKKSEGEARRFLKDGDPIKNDGYTEFHVALEKDKIENVTVFDAELRDPLDRAYIGCDISSLLPTPKSAAVRFYCDEYRKVDRWNADTVKAFVEKCKPHKDHLGEIWNRLEKMDRAMNDAKELFAVNPK